MQKPSPLIWLFLFLVLILPTAAGRFLLDLAGGIILTFFSISLIIACIGWLGWKRLQARMTTCSVCGVQTFSNNTNCPICGSMVNQESNINNLDMQAKEATIDIEAKDIDNE